MVIDIRTGKPVGHLASQSADMRDAARQLKGIAADLQRVNRNIGEAMARFQDLRAALLEA